METAAPRRYRLLKCGLEIEQRRLLAANIPVYFFILAAALIVSLFLGYWHGNTSQRTIAIAIFTGSYLAFLAFALPRKVKKNLAKLWDSYELEIGPDYLLRKQADTADLRLSFDEITSIQRLPGRYLRIIGPSRKDVIGIPESLENFEEILGLVSASHVVNLQSGELWKRRAMYLTAAAVAYLSMLYAKSPYLYLPLAFGLACLAVWTVWSVRRNPNASRQMRRGVFVYLFLLIPCLQRIFQGAELILKR